MADIRKVFDEATCIEDVKEIFRKWAKKTHPDVREDKERAHIQMVALNAAYEAAYDKWQNWHKSTRTEDSYYKEDANAPTADQFRDIILALIKLEGVEIELCGSWIWVSGDTKPHKDEIKALGCYWAAQKKLWYWRPESEAKRYYKGKGKKTIEEIRETYGSVNGRDYLGK